MQFTGIHINFFDRIKVNIGTFSVPNVPPSPPGYPHNGSDQGAVMGKDIAPILMGKQTPLLTYDAFGRPRLLRCPTGVIVDRYI